MKKPFSFQEEVDRLDVILRDIQYKKGVYIGLYVVHTGVYLNIRVNVTDVTNGLENQISMYESLQLGIPRDHLIRLVYTKLVALETHEASEWFHYRGQSIYNEHALQDACTLQRTTHPFMGLYDPTKDAPVDGPSFKPPSPKIISATMASGDEFELTDVEFTSVKFDEKGQSDGRAE